MLKKLFKKADAKKTVKVEKLNKKEMDKVIGGATTTNPDGDKHRPPRDL
jgi:bacteriocin-like protein